MVLELDHHGGVPIYRQVMEQIRREIVIGHLQPGDQVESVKSVSARLKVNPMTISKAYGFLVEEGLLERRRGVGLFVQALRKETRRRQRERLLERGMHRAAALAAQAGLSEKEAVAQFLEQFRKFEARSRSE